ncbi:MAG: DUF883 family protein [Bacteroidetes bacterium]|nr:DUF883 family protein [Bacteroidota bacterium]
MNKSTLDTLTSRINELSEAGKQYLENEDLQQRIEELKTDAEKLVKDHPLAAVGIGLAVGYLLGRLFSRD